ncbi:hypothetical protein D3C77_530160 [compost metagenome]
MHATVNKPIFRGQTPLLLNDIDFVPYQLPKFLPTIGRQWQFLADGLAFQLSCSRAFPGALCLIPRENSPPPQFKRWCRTLNTTPIRQSCWIPTTTFSPPTLPTSASLALKANLPSAINVTGFPIITPYHATRPVNYVRCARHGAVERLSACYTYTTPRAAPNMLMWSCVRSLINKVK